MNEQNTKTMEAAVRLMEARDADIKAAEQKALADDISPDLQIIYAALGRIDTRISGTLAVSATAKRKRAKTVAKEPVMEAVCKYLSRIEDDTPVATSVIAEKIGFGPLVTRKACEELDKRGWIKHFAGKGYRWIPEAEAERENGFNREELENGPVMIDDIKEENGA